MQEKIIEVYTNYLLENGEKPASVYAFCKKLKIKEASFYNEFNSFTQIDSKIWQQLFLEARLSAEQESVYPSYSVREKLLAFFYTWIEILKNNRSYALLVYQDFNKPIFSKKNAELADFKQSFLDYANELLLEARETREVEQRPIPILMQYYPDLLWFQALFILDFWINDSSKLYEKTDTMIEKSVNTIFDLLGHSPLDSLFDLGKFIYQNR